MAFRIFRKQRLSSAITVAGWGIGLAFFALLAVTVRDELSFDRFHAKAGRIYFLTSEFRGQFIGGSHHFVAKVLESEYPEIKPGSTVRVAANGQTIRRGSRRVVKDFIFCDPGFLKLFSFPLVAGDPDRALADPGGIILTAATAEALGLGPDRLGEALTVRIGEAEKDFLLTGIIKDTPANSSLKFDGLLPFSQVFEALHVDPNNTDFVTLPMFAMTFLEIRDKRAAAALRAKLPGLSDRLYGDMWRRINMDPPKRGLDLFPLADYHLGPVRSFILGPRSRPAFSWILSGIALLILVLACFNAVSLSLARSSSRMKEIGIRKVAGARRRHLLSQFILESLLAGLAALIAGLSAAAFLVPSFNGLTGKAVRLSDLLHPSILAAAFAAIAIGSFITGLAPARFLSRQPAALIVRGRLAAAGSGGRARFFIVAQFAASIALLTGMLVMARQLRFVTGTDLGYDSADIVFVDTQIPDEEAALGGRILEAFRNALRSDPRVLAVTADSGIFPDGGGGITRRYDKDGVEHVFEAFQIDENYLQAMNIGLVAGTGYSREGTAGAREGVLVNEALVKDFALENFLGRRFSEFARDKLPAEYSSDPKIIGVVRDFHVSSLHEPIAPMAFGLKSFIPAIQGFRAILVKTRPGEMTAVAGALEKIWASVRPDVPIRYDFLEEALARAYRRDRNWSRIVGWAGGFALFISCLGLFGLTAVSVIRRTKEIGIRKVLGAGKAEILILFLKEYLKGAAVAALLSWPIAYWAAGKWLDQFAYRIRPDIGSFASAALLAMWISSLTISAHVLRAVQTDPSRNLRAE